MHDRCLEVAQLFKLCINVHLGDRHVITETTTKQSLRYIHIYATRTICILAQTVVDFQCVNDVQLLLWRDVWNRFVLKCELIAKG